MTAAAQATRRWRCPAPAPSGAAVTAGSLTAVWLTRQPRLARRASNVRVYEDGRGDWVSPGLSEADSYLEQVDAFAGAINGEREVSPASEDGVAAVRLIEAAAQSVATGREVNL